MNRRRHSIFRGWWVVLTAAIGLFWAPVTIFSFSVFLKPLMQSFHAGRAAVSLAFTLNSIAAAVSAPLAGWWTATVCDGLSCRPRLCLD
jgi:predicted MFS family arabinose efflux permease